MKTEEATSRFLCDFQQVFGGEMDGVMYTCGETPDIEVGGRYVISANDHEE